MNKHTEFLNSLLPDNNKLVETPKTKVKVKKNKERETKVIFNEHYSDKELQGVIKRFLNHTHVYVEHVETMSELEFFINRLKKQGYQYAILHTEGLGYSLVVDPKQFETFVHESESRPGRVAHGLALSAKMAERRRAAQNG
jgi:membrane-anchored protein YejM (alkaline phosphatase superfamily)